MTAKLVKQKLYYMNKGFAKGTIIFELRRGIIEQLSVDRLDGEKLYEERYKDSIESITSKIIDEVWVEE